MCQFTIPTPPAPGPYSAVLTVVDNAGNEQSVRRIFIFDDTSTVTKDETTPVRVLSASPNTNYEWIVTSEPNLLVNWTSRFLNKLHHSGKWLNAVSAEHGIRYDDHEGLRTIAGIPNVLGRCVCKLIYFACIYPVGG
jgi:hypothetical protein